VEEIIFDSSYEKAKTDMMIATRLKKTPDPMIFLGTKT